MFEVLYSAKADAKLTAMGRDRSAAKKLRKVMKTLALISQDPSYPSLQSHPYTSLKSSDGKTVWDSYVENNTPSAWRIFWWYGPEDGQITILSIGPHP